MSRSIGDRVAHSVGVSADPEINEVLLGVDDKILILASDGVWEFLSN
jgi:serine/threonine protein phosphatase PrpC